MTVVKRNIIANFAGQGWSALMALVFVPLYIKFLGIEAYGLIGFYAMLQSVFQILDLGLSQTMNREMARYAVQPEKAGEARDLARTLEVGYWAVGIIIGIGVVIVAPLIARHWIKPGSIPVGTVQHAVMIMGVVSALQWPLSFYEGGLRGLQQQVLFNGVRIGIATLGGFGAVFILWKVSPTITAYFTWQIIVNALSVTLLTVFLWRSLPSSGRPTLFRPSLLRNIWRFVAGMSGISISAIALMQMDKILLSRLVSLEMFGYYALAGIVSNIVPSLLVSPIFSALFPRFAALVAVDDETSFRNLYHQGIQLTAVIILPVAAVLAFFSFDIILLWTRDPEVARIVSPILTVLVVGMALNGLTALTFAVQLAYGWTKIGLSINIFFIITIIPSIYFMATHYGAIGAAVVWLVLNIIYIVIVFPLTHRRVLRDETRRVYAEDIGPPLTASLAVVGLGRWLFTTPATTLSTIVVLSLIVCAAFAASAFSAPRIRSWILTEYI